METADWIEEGLQMSRSMICMYCLVNNVFKLADDFAEASRWK